MKFDYGDAVVANQTDVEGHPSKRACSVVAITPIDTDDQAHTSGYPKGTVLYTVEFGDGSDTVVPEDLLQLVE